MNRIFFTVALVIGAMVPSAYAQQLKAFASDVRIVPILSYASGTADRVSNVVDMKGYDSCIIVVHFAAIAAGGTNSIFLQEANVASNATTLTSGADLAGTLQTVADDDDNELKYIDVKKPLKRYLQLNVDKDTSNACAESAVAYLYNASERPVAHAEGTGTGGGVDIVEGEAFLSPIAGTK